MRAAFVLALVVLTGCSVTRSVTPGAASGAQANEALAGRTVVVHLTDGRAVEAQSVTVLPDLTSWFDPGTRELVEVSTAEIVRVSDRSRGRAAGQGALIAGFGIAALMTAGILLDTDDWGYFENAKPLIALTAGTVSGIMAAPLGGGVGYATGSETRYEVAPAAGPSVGPTDGARSVPVGER